MSLSDSKPRRSPGRPPKPPGEKADLRKISIRLTPDEAAELRRRGVAEWLRPLLRQEARP